MATFLKRTDGRWEEVDAFTLTNYKKAVLNDKPRYNGDKFVFNENGTCSVHLDNVTRDDLIQLARLTGITGKEAAWGSINPIVQPLEVLFQNLRGRNIRRSQDGTIWTQQTPKIVEKAA